MRPGIVARNYAETLLALAQRQGGDSVEAYGRAMEEVAELLRQEPRIEAFLANPSIDTDAKKRALRASFGGRVPEMFLRFLLLVADKGRERLFQEIAAAYRDEVDRLFGRVRAEVVLASPADSALQEQIRTELERRLDKTVIPHFRVDPALLGGIVVRVEDEIMDGSVRSRLAVLRRRLLDTRIPQQA